MDDDAWAEEIWQARQQGQLLPAPSRRGERLELDQAYRVQQSVTARRIAAGERVVGWKLGYTSMVMRTQMGIDEPNFGPLTDIMVLPNGAMAPDFLRQPRVEPEVALIVSDDIEPGTPWYAVGQYVAAAHAALEVVDSTWLDYRFDLADNTADSSSTGAFVLGDQISVGLLAAVQVDLEVTGHGRHQGTADAAMGDPTSALAWLVEQLGRRGETLYAGSIVLTGGLTRAIPLEVGATARATFHSAVETDVVLLHR